MKMRNTQRVLTLAIMAALLSGGGTVWASSAPPAATETVTGSGNTSHATNMYNTITVSSDNRNAVFAINNATGTVYVKDGAIISAIGAGENISGSAKNVQVYGVFGNNTVNVGMNGEAKGNVTITAEATGGTASSTDANANATANACGLSAFLGTNTIEGNATITAEATGGTVSSTDADAYANANANAYGLSADSDYTNTIDGNATITAEATGGTVSSTDADAYANANAYGLCADKGTNIINGNVEITAEATGGTASSTDANANATAYAYGLFSDVGINIIKGDAIIKADATATQQGQRFRAYSLFGKNGRGNDLSRTDQITQLQGDVYAEDSCINKITLDTETSYLRGNLLHHSYELGTNYLTIANGATWQPVYDNRYGTWYTSAGAGADETLRMVANNAIAITVNDEITLRDGGIIDLTWDGWKDGAYAPMTGRSSGYRTLTINSLSGNGGIFRIDTDLANGNADKITLNSATSGSTMQIQVNYDPFFATNPATGDTLAAKDGGVGVLNGTAANTITVTGAESEYNAYKFTPTVVWNATNSQWEITSLTTMDVPPVPPTPTPTPEPEPTPTPTPTPTVTTNVMTAADSRMVVNEMFLADTNSLNKRLGELRSTKSEGGIWARYGHGKLKNGEGRRAELKYNLFQVGYDKSNATDSGSTVYRGLAVTHTKGDSSYETGSGESKYTNLALYQTWLGKGNDYYDVILKYGRLSNDYNMVDISGNYSTADYASHAWTLSGEYGKRFALGGGYFEPNAELILGHIGSADYTTSKGMKVNVDASKHAITRLGFNLGKEFTNANIYFKANYYHDFAGGGGIVADTVSYSREGFKNWYELGLGGATKLGKNTSAYAEVNKYFGDMKSDVTFNVGLRYSF